MAEAPIVRNVLTNLLVWLPSALTLVLYGARMLGRAGLPAAARRALIALYVAATLAPLSMNFAGSDTARWAAMSTLTCFSCFLAIRLTFAPRAAALAGGATGMRVESPWLLLLTALAVVLGLCTMFEGYLFDATVVHWFPFDTHVNSLIDLVRGHFTFIPGA